MILALRLSLLLSVVVSPALFAQEYLVRLKDPSAFILEQGETLSLVSKAGQLYKWTTTQPERAQSTWADHNVDYIQPNRMISLIENPSLAAARPSLIKQIDQLKEENRPSFEDNPEIQTPTATLQGQDPQLAEAWGVLKIGSIDGHAKYPQGKGIVVAVTDTGVDYNHEDLINNIWHNTKEIAGDEIDNDNNGYIDDVIGWDFATDDNQPYDLSLSMIEIILMGGNPGHGTHVAGVIAASLNNSKGIVGVAPKAKIMPLRFLNEKGQGSLEGAVKAIDYAVANGANIINASWGGESNGEPDPALVDAISRAEDAGVIFVAAAGNGRNGVGFDNDNDPKPVEPASYDLPLMVCVAALDAEDKLAGFSNWGAKSVKVGAPGVKILSTVPGNRYQDTVLNFGSTTITWDGTSMASPHVAGALALLWSDDITQSATAVRDRLLGDVLSVDELTEKVATSGSLQIR